MRQMYINEIFRKYRKVWESDHEAVERLMGEMVTISGAWKKDAQTHRRADGGVYLK